MYMVEACMEYSRTPGFWWNHPYGSIFESVMNLKSWAISTELSGLSPSMAWVFMGKTDACDRKRRNSPTAANLKVSRPSSWSPPLPVLHDDQPRHNQDYPETILHRRSFVLVNPIHLPRPFQLCLPQPLHFPVPAPFLNPPLLLRFPISPTPFQPPRQPTCNQYFPLTHQRRWFPRLRLRCRRRPTTSPHPKLDWPPTTLLPRPHLPTPKLCLHTTHTRRFEPSLPGTPLLPIHQHILVWASCPFL
jgi:hypothetical protein